MYRRADERGVGCNLDIRLKGSETTLRIQQIFLFLPALQRSAVTEDENSLIDNINRHFTAETDIKQEVLK